MDEKKELEKVLDTKVKPIVESAMQKFLGVTISEIETDISDKIKKSPMLEFEIFTDLPFKKAKKAFKRFYISRLLRTHFGNVSEVAKILRVDRRSIHRLIKQLKIEIKRFRKELKRAEYIRREAVRGIIETTLDSYKTIINPEKLKDMYAHAGEVSGEIAKELPETPMTLKQAEEEFEKKYLKTFLEQNNWNMSKTAKQIGLRYETLYRKIKALGIRH